MSIAKRLAMRIFGCGKDKVWLDPQKLKEISQAKTGVEIRNLISKGYIVRKWNPSEKLPRYYDHVYKFQKKHTSFQNIRNPTPKGFPDHYGYWKQRSALRKLAKDDKTVSENISSEKTDHLPSNAL